VIIAILILGWVSFHFLIKKTSDATVWNSSSKHRCSPNMKNKINWGANPANFIIPQTAECVNAQGGGTETLSKIS